MSTSQPNVPPGFCGCGCGEQTKLPPSTNRSKGWTRGVPLRYVHGHNNGHPPRRPLDSYHEPRDCGHGTPCWVWCGSLNPDGYGLYSDGSHGDALRKRPAHRVVYEHHRGPIPESLHIDHLCRNRACVNPAHLEPVTQAENTRRGVTARAAGRP